MGEGEGAEGVQQQDKGISGGEDGGSPEAPRNPPETCPEQGNLREKVEKGVWRDLLVTLVWLVG